MIDDELRRLGFGPTIAGGPYPRWWRATDRALVEIRENDDLYRWDSEAFIFSSTSIDELDEAGPAQGRLL